jgi:hypothetical protein
MAMTASVGEKMGYLNQKRQAVTVFRMILVVVLMMAITVLVSCDSTNSEEETAMVSNQRILLEHFDIPEKSAERIAGAMESVGIGQIESIEIDEQLQSLFTFYVTDDKGEKFHLVVSADGSLGTICKDGPGGEYLWGVEL